MGVRTILHFILAGDRGVVISAKNLTVRSVRNVGRGTCSSNLVEYALLLVFIALVFLVTFYFGFVRKPADSSK